MFGASPTASGSHRFLPPPRLIWSDRLGNTRTTTFSVVFDDGPPSIEFTNLSFISLDEEPSGKGGSMFIALMP